MQRQTWAWSSPLGKTIKSRCFFPVLLTLKSHHTKLFHPLKYFALIGQQRAMLNSVHRMSHFQYDANLYFVSISFSFTGHTNYLCHISVWQILASPPACPIFLATDRPDNLLCSFQSKIFGDYNSLLSPFAHLTQTFTGLQAVLCLGTHIPSLATVRPQVSLYLSQSTWQISERSCLFWIITKLRKLLPGDKDICNMWQIYFGFGNYTMGCVKMLSSKFVSSTKCCLRCCAL